ncbi:hypothetical protein IAT40_007791 [Kwoniella sp. CBS 6097]
MERSSSQRDLRSERLSKTPYTRPGPSSSRLRKSTSMTPLATLKSIVSYVSSPFTRSSTLLPTHSSSTHNQNQDQNHDQDLDVQVDNDQKSESGSEDNWNGEPPENMQGQDVFSLAAAAGRRGDEFEERASAWRSRGEKPGGRRELARLGLEAQPTKSSLEPPTPTAPGHFALMKSSPSMPLLSSSSTTNAQSSSLQVPFIAGPPRASGFGSGLGSSSTLTRARSALAISEQNNTTLPPRSPLPSFVPPAISTPQQQLQTAGVGLSSSASSVALTAFLEAKKGQQMTPDDFRVIETLTDNMKAESHVGSPPRSAGKINRWAAGSYPSSGSGSKTGLQSSRSFIGLSTPAKQSPNVNGGLSTPGQVFAVGTMPTPGSNHVKASPYKQRYLGPGMSPRRMFPQPKKSSLKPLFNFGAAPDDEIAKGNKKRKTGEEEDEAQESMEVDETSSSLAKSAILGSPSQPAKGLSSSVSMPSLAGSTKPSSLDRSSSKLSVGPIHTPVRPSPLSRSINKPESPVPTSSPGPVDEKAKRKAEAEAAGKKRAAEIIMDIIDEEIGPVVPTRQAEPIVFNPYDRNSLNPSPAPAVPSSTPSKAFAGSTPRKGGAGGSGSGGAISPARRTPTRGAAAKLEAHREAMKGSKPLTTIDRIKGVRPWETRGSPSRSTGPGRVEAPTPDDDIIEIDELVDESEAASASASSRAPSPAPAPASAFAPAAQGPSTKPAAPSFTSASAKIPPAETFKPFSPPTVSFSSQPLPKSASANAPSIGSFDSPTRDSIIAASKTSSQQNAVPKPTFSFTPSPAPAKKQEQESELVKPASASAPVSPASASSSKLDVNAIYLSAKDSALKIAKPALPFFTFTLPPRPLESAKTKEQAEAAEAVRREASQRPAPTFSFTLTAEIASVKPAANANAGTGGAEWTCTLCMLKNPGSATEKCTVCENPKPTSAPTKASGSGSASASSASSTSSGPWTCSLCMLQNPASATEKCTICEAPKPAAGSAKSAAPAPAFSFGASPSVLPSTSGGDGVGPWTCSLCMLQNPASATEKCTICEAPKPASSAPASTSAAAPASTPFTGFGAGFGPKKAAGGGEWTCSTCMLQNPDSAKEKCTICEAKRP